MDAQAIARAAIEIYRRNLTEHYFDMNGRVSREEFWVFILASVVVGIAVGVVANILNLYLLSSLYGLAMLLPTAGLAARRLQDTGKPGATVWIAVIPAAIVAAIGFLFALGGLVGALGFLLFYLTIGWLINLVALIAVIYVGYLCAQPGVVGPNQYGPEPVKPDLSAARPAT
jgi:uncharacterized membrane protein YhaH (DUF805 family)